MTKQKAAPSKQVSSNNDISDISKTEQAYMEAREVERQKIIVRLNEVLTEAQEKRFRVVPMTTIIPGEFPQTELKVI